MKIGFATPVGMWRGNLEHKLGLMNKIADAGVDHLFMADHVSFRNGSGTDGFIEVAALSQLHDTMGVMIGIYLLPLRHPLPVARQMASMQEVAPGRFIFGVGIGGEDRHEIEVCGVDPSTRGRRMNESLAILRALQSGEPIDFRGEFFDLQQAQIKPALKDSIPIIIGGRSNAALKRCGKFGDGWLGVWCSVRRYSEALTIIDEAAEAEGRVVSSWQHGYQPWVGVADTRDEARSLVAEAMESFYKVPFESFEKYVPFGTPEEVAQQLAPYAAAGCTNFNLKVVAGTDEEAIAATKVMSAELRS